MKRREEGQALVLIALILPVLVALLLGAVEIGRRMWQRAQVEDALHQASRSTVQLFAYEPFASDGRQLRDQDEIIAIAREHFAASLHGVGGLRVSPEQAAALVQWTILEGPGAELTGACAKASVPIDGPAVCASIDLPMVGLAGWGDWTPHIVAVETLDLVEP